MICPWFSERTAERGIADAELAVREYLSEYRSLADTSQPWAGWLSRAVPELDARELMLPMLQEALQTSQLGAVLVTNAFRPNFPSWARCATNEKRYPANNGHFPRPNRSMETTCAGRLKRSPTLVRNYPSRRRSGKIGLMELLQCQQACHPRRSICRPPPTAASLHNVALPVRPGVSLSLTLTLAPSRTDRLPHLPGRGRQPERDAPRATRRQGRRLRRRRQSRVPALLRLQLDGQERRATLRDGAQAAHDKHAPGDHGGPPKGDPPDLHGGQARRCVPARAPPHRTAPPLAASHPPGPRAPHRATPPSLAGGIAFHDHASTWFALTHGIKVWWLGPPSRSLSLAAVGNGPRAPTSPCSFLRRAPWSNFTCRSCRVVVQRAGQILFFGQEVGHATCALTDAMGVGNQLGWWRSHYPNLSQTPSCTRFPYTGAYMRHCHA